MQREEGNKGGNKNKLGFTKGSILKTFLARMPETFVQTELNVTLCFQID